MAPASSKEFLDIQANYRVWIHSETCTWHDNNIGSVNHHLKWFSFSDIYENKRLKYCFIAYLFIAILSNILSYFSSEWNKAKHPKKHTASIWCNFADQKIHVVYTYFSRLISMVKIFTFFPRTFFDVRLMVEKSVLFTRHFLYKTSMGKKSKSFFG